MNYQSEDLKNALAAEYVLGTLRGPARQRFQKLMMQFPLISDATQTWEQHLNGLGQKIPPVTPDIVVWQRIEDQLGFVAQPTKTNVVAITKSKPRIWQSIAGLASAAAIVLAVLLFSFQPPLQPEVQQLALMSNEQADLLWALEIGADTISVQATKKLIAKSDADYELWIVAVDGRPPISLGLLPKVGKLVLSKPQLFDQIEIAALAVSLEPLGGSPNGSPTTVLYTSELVIL
ncbi:anti-sigma factor [Colwellia hornerae]|uniref:Anti-sigma factor n=1 Tax=Colwellia hornerae TaxID=89402 RepID=A0A5C6QP22_9GAMM|nr:anti-sigma factor [Colwellia hornerae]TWX54619.1 anti-sigma factor [Colwellia hornerae]TWX61059.1 anti-sigma factor [Colwellia hornerae]TWX70312.1 anti-sigma factor [Colwellia hornerae]